MEFFRVYGRVLGLLKEEKGLVAWLVVANVAVAGMQFYEPVIFGRVVELLRAPTDKTGDLLWQQTLAQLGLWTVIGLGGIAANIVVSLQADRMAHRRRLMVMARYFEHVLELPYAFHNTQHSGRLLKVMLTGVDNLFSVWLSFFRENLATFAALFIMLPLSLFMNWRLGLLLIVLILFFAASNAYIVNRTDRLQARVEDYHSELASRARTRWERSSHPELRPARRRGQRAAPRHPRGAGGAVPGAELVGAAVGADARRLDGDRHPDLPAGHLALYPRHGHGGRDRELHGLRHHADRAHGAGLRLHQPGLLPDAGDGRFLPHPRHQSSVPDRPDAIDIGRAKGHVAFEDVSFSYDGRRPALVHFTLDVPAGTTVALRRPDGRRQKHALSLLHRMWDPQSGVIRIDGIDHRDIALDIAPRNIGVVFQDITMFYRSIGDNLRVGKPDATPAELEAAAKLAEAHDFIMRQPNGYDTLVGERGTTLSGGERQRLSIARALLENPPILILDEATSALDALTEARIQKALKVLMAGRTTFVIAHRLSTIRDADLIVVFEHGRVVEKGSYQELIRPAVARLHASSPRSRLA